MKIKIKDIYYKIIPCKRIEKEINENSLVLGDTNYFKKTIAIVCDTELCCKELIRKIIIHELTHAYLFEYGISNHWISSYEKGFEEEKVCDFVAWYGEDILRDSKKVYNHLFEKGQE